jgi:aldose 1-epimerase
VNWFPSGTRYNIAAGDHSATVVEVGGGIRDAFTGLAHDPAGRAWVSLAAPLGRTVRLWVDQHYRYLELYTGDTQPAEVRRRGLGVEPLTCAPTGFATGEGLRTLEPGQSVTTRWGIQPG